MLPEYQRNWAFFLDIDGTLLEQAESPDAVRVDRGVQGLLVDLRAAVGGALALISGRALPDMDALFPLAKLPAAGQHGIERRDAGGSVHVRAFGQAAMRQSARELLRFVVQRPGLMLEDKGYTLALHYRQAPQYEEEALHVVQGALAMLGGGFELQRGKMVYEIKPGGTDKGTAVETFMSESPFSGRTPVFIGDDHTDEHGFDVVNRLGGYSVKVGDGPTAAGWRAASPDVVRTWLAGWLKYQIENPAPADPAPEHDVAQNKTDPAAIGSK